MKIFDKKQIIIFAILATFVLAPTKQASALLGVPTMESDPFTLAAFDSTALSSGVTAQATTELEIKETFLDGIVYALINIVIQQLSQSLVTWIKSGFHGSPGFITNPGSFFLGVANRASGAVIAELGANFLCSPFAPSLQFKLNFGLDYPQYRNKRVECTLMGALRNAQGFAAYTQGQFDVAGMAGLLSISEPQNNPYGAFIYASAEVQAEGIRQRELQEEIASWNRGFKSVTEQLSQANGKIQDIIRTPGTFVEDQLNDSLDSSKRRIEAADEISEIFGALLSQLLTTVTSGLTGGSASADTSALDFGSPVPECKPIYDATGQPTIDSSGKQMFELSTPGKPCITPSYIAFIADACPVGDIIDPATGQQVPSKVFTDATTGISYTDSTKKIQCLLTGLNTSAVSSCPAGHTIMPDGSPCRITSSSITGTGRTGLRTGGQLPEQIYISSEVGLARNGHFLQNDDCTIFGTTKKVANGNGPAGLAFDGAVQTYTIAYCPNLGKTGPMAWSLKLYKPEWIKRINMEFQYRTSVGDKLRLFTSPDRTAFIEIALTPSVNVIEIDLLGNKALSGGNALLIYGVEIESTSYVELAELKLFRYFPPVIKLPPNPNIAVQVDQVPNTPASWNTVLLDKVTMEDSNPDPVTGLPKIITDLNGLTVTLTDQKATDFKQTIPGVTSLAVGQYVATYTYTMPGAPAKGIVAPSVTRGIAITPIPPTNTGDGPTPTPAPTQLSVSCTITPPGQVLNPTPASYTYSSGTYVTYTALASGGVGGQYTYQWATSAQNGYNYPITLTNTTSADISYSERVTVTSGGAPVTTQCPNAIVRPQTYTPPVARTLTLTQGQNDPNVSVTLPASGGTTPYTYYVDTLPAGGTLTMIVPPQPAPVPVTIGTAILGGSVIFTPSNPGPYATTNFTFHVVDNAGTVSAGASINISKPI